MRGIIKTNIYLKKRTRELYVFPQIPSESQVGSFKNGGILPRVASTNGEVGSRGRRSAAGRPISINNPFFQHEVGFIQPPLNGESQLRNP